MGPPGADEDLKLRSRSLPRSSSPDGTKQNKPRVIRAPRIRRRSKAAKNDGKGGPEITTALSILTKDMTHIPIRDMEAWVNRPADVRRKEVLQKNGKISRPMNSFMLYRSAYAERTKEWCAQNNHQIISRASGQSWPLEPEEVRNQFERYAQIERNNHQLAHPNYKFAPNKNHNTPKKKRGHDDDDSDIDDPEYDIGDYGRTVSRKRQRVEPAEFGSRNTTPFDQDSSYNSRQQTPFEHHGDIMSGADMNRSSWETIYPGKPLPDMLSPPEQTNYFKPSVQQSRLGPNIEDITFKRMGVSRIQYDAPSTLASLPGNPHPDLLQPQHQPPPHHQHHHQHQHQHQQQHPHTHPAPPPPPSHQQHQSQNGNNVGLDGTIQVDPQLLEFDNRPVSLPTSTTAAAPDANCPGQLDIWQLPLQGQTYMPNGFSAQEAEQYPHAVTAATTAAATTSQAYHPSMQAGIGIRGMWNEGAPVESGTEFDNWFGSAPQY